MLYVQDKNFFSFAIKFLDWATLFLTPLFHLNQEEEMKHPIDPLPLALSGVSVQLVTQDFLVRYVISLNKFFFKSNLLYFLTYNCSSTNFLELCTRIHASSKVSERSRMWAMQLQQQEPNLHGRNGSLLG